MPHTNKDQGGVEEIVLNWLKEEEKDNYVKGTLETSYTLDGIFDLSILVDSLHQELQKARDEQRERDAYLIRTSGWHTAEKLARKIFGGAEVNWYTQKQLDGRIKEARHDWLREEIVKLEGMRHARPLDDYDGGYTHAIDDILLRYQSELDQPTDVK